MRQRDLCRMRGGWCSATRTCVRLVANHRRVVPSIDGELTIREGDREVPARADVTVATDCAIALEIEEDLGLSILEFDLIVATTVLQNDHAHSSLELEVGVALMCLCLFECHIECDFKPRVRVH